MDYTPPDVIGDLRDDPDDRSDEATLLQRRLRQAEAQMEQLYLKEFLSVDQYGFIAETLADGALFMRTLATPHALLVAELTAARAVIRTLDEVQRNEVSASALRIAVANYKATARAAERWRRRGEQLPLNEGETDARD